MMMLIVPMTVMAQKFGHVDSQTLLKGLPEIAKIDGELQALAAQYEKKLKEMQDELKRKYDEYEKTKATMSAAAQKEAETSLQELSQKVQQTYNDSQQDLEKQKADKLTPVYDKVRKAIDNVGKAGQYTYIFESGEFLYVGANAKDISAEIKAELEKMK